MLKAATTTYKPQSAMADAPMDRKVELTIAALRLYLGLRWASEQMDSQTVRASTYPEIMTALPSTRLNKQRLIWAANTGGSKYRARATRAFGRGPHLAIDAASPSYYTHAEIFAAFREHGRDPLQRPVAAAEGETTCTWRRAAISKQSHASD